MESKEALEVKKIITSLLISTPMRSSMHQLAKDFYEMEGRNIPFRQLGFMGLEEYLRSIPDVVNVYGSGPLAEVEAVITSKSEHINLMVLKQKKTKKLSHKFYQKVPKRPSYFQGQAKEKYISSAYNKPYNPKNSVIEGGSQNNVENIKSQNNESHFAAEKYISCAYNKPYNPKNSVIEGGSQNDVENIKSQNNESHFAQTYSSPDVKEPSKALIFIDDDESPVLAEANCVYISKSEPSEDLGDVKTFEIDKVEKYDSKEDYPPRIPRKVYDNLKQLIERFSDGIECTKLPKEYRNMFKKRIYYEEYGYRSAIEMCLDLPQIFRYIQLTSHDYMLYDKNKSILDLKQEVYVTKRVYTEEASQKHVLEGIPKSSEFKNSPLMPPDVLDLSDEISRLFPSDVVVGDLLEVNIGDIYDLSKFWIYMTFGDLKSLMQDLQQFFTKNRKSYQIPELLLEEGLYCVTIYANEYHRCVIVNLLPKIPNFVRVFFVDYGTVYNVPTDEIWFLPKQFGETPCQAIRARLANIYPVYENRPWSAKALARFSDLVINRVLVAEVTRVDEQDHILEVYLADITNKERIFYINDIFVEEGYALYTDQDRKKNYFVDHDCVPNVRFIHLYPEFYEIEAGMAPTTEEMEYIIKNNSHLPYFMPQYFDIHYYEDIGGIQLQHEKFNQMSVAGTTIPTVEPEDFDFSFFPDCLRDEIKELYEQEKPDQKKQSTKTTIKKEYNDNGESTTKESVKEYFCNKSRISELIYGNTNKTETCESKHCDNSSIGDLFSVKSSSDLSNSSIQSPEIVPLNNSFQQLGLNNSGSWVKNTSTNPFLNFDRSDKSTSTNPFRSTNPFLNDLEETASANSVYNFFNKSSDEVLPQKILNNLKDSNTSRRKMNKQVNVERSANFQTLNSASGVNTSFMSASSDSFTTPEKKEAEAPPRVRTPPGFSSTNLQNRAATSFTQSAPNHFQNHLYFQNLLSHFYNTNYLPPNQFNVQPNQFSVQPNQYNVQPNQFSVQPNPQLMGNYYPHLPQFYPNQFNLNSNWGRNNFPGPPPHDKS